MTNLGYISGFNLVFMELGSNESASLRVWLWINLSFNSVDFLHFIRKFIQKMEI